MKQLVILTASVTVATYALIKAFFVLLINLDKIAKASCILLCHEGGFGHTLCAPDWLRRIHPDEEWLVLFAYQKGRHNIWVRDLWGKNRFIWIPCGLSFPRIGYFSPVPSRRVVFSILKLIFRFVFPKKRVFSYLEMIRETPPSDKTSPNSPFNKAVEARLFDRCVNASAKRVYLPELLRNRVKKELDRVGGSNKAPYCTLFVRAGGHRVGVDYSSVNRNGSEITEYLPAIRFLIERGYRVLLTGNRILTPQMRDEFGTNVIDWPSLNIDRDLFFIYAGTEAAFHIGQMSGGSTFTHVNKIPCLILNGFPFGHCLPEATVYYKKLIDEKGDVVSPHVLFRDFFFDYNVRPDRVLTNSAEEIKTAVRDFVENRRDTHPYGILDEEAGLYSESLAAGNARISPVWISISDQLSLGKACATLPKHSPES